MRGREGRGEKKGGSVCPAVVDVAAVDDDGGVAVDVVAAVVGRVQTLREGEVRHSL